MSPEMIALYIAIIGASSAVATLGIRTCLKSNCTSVDLCWGMISYQRNDETEADQLEIAPVAKI